MGSTFQEIEIVAPADKVWQAIRDFHDASWAPNVVTSIEAVGDKAGDKKGAGRIINVASGGMYTQPLEVDLLQAPEADYSGSVAAWPSPRKRPCSARESPSSKRVVSVAPV